MWSINQWKLVLKSYSVSQCWTHWWFLYSSPLFFIELMFWQTASPIISTLLITMQHKMPSLTKNKAILGYFLAVSFLNTQKVCIITIAVFSLFHVKHLWWNLDHSYAHVRLFEWFCTLPSGPQCMKHATQGWQQPWTLISTECSESDGDWFHQ